MVVFYVFRVSKEPEIGASNEDSSASSKVTGMDLEMLQTTIEQTVSKMLQSSEDKMMKYIDFRLDTLESRLNKKLDCLVQLLEKNCHPPAETNEGTGS